MLHYFLSLVLCIASLLWSLPLVAIPCYPTGNCYGNGDGYVVYADCLYWKAVQDNMDYAVKGVVFQDGNIPANHSKISLVEPTFKYHVGFRIGAGYQVPCTDCDVQISWTSTQNTVSSSVTDKGNIFPLAATIDLGTLTSNMLVNSAKSHWRYSFDIIDLHAGGNFPICDVCDITVRPYVGVRAAIFQQKQHVNFLEIKNALGIPLILKTSERNDFRGIGPSIGIDASWLFCSEWSLSGGISAAVLYGKFESPLRLTISTIPIKPKMPPVSSTIAIKSDKRYRLRPNVNAYLGIDWNSSWCDRFQVKVGLAYEMQYWWNQWQVPGNVIDLFTSGAKASQGDLMLHGLTFRVTYLF